MNRDEALTALSHLERLARLSPSSPEAIVEFRRVVATLKALPGSGPAFRENLAEAEASAAKLFAPHEQAKSAYTGRTFGVSLTILLLADIAAARRNLPDGLT